MTPMEKTCLCFFFSLLFKATPLPLAAVQSMYNFFGNLQSIIARIE